MSTLPIAKDALLALLHTFSYDQGDSDPIIFTNANSSVDDPTVLSRDEVSALIETTADSIEGDAFEGNSQGEYVEVHQIGMWVAVRRGSARDGANAAKRRASELAEAIKDYIRQYEQFNHGYPIARAQIVKTSVPGYLVRVDGKKETATHAGVLIEWRVRCEGERNPIEAGS